MQHRLYDFDLDQRPPPSRTKELLHWRQLSPNLPLMPSVLDTSSLICGLWEQEGGI
jgi:hypothetical protein